jgi:hypothetical protein
MNGGMYKDDFQPVGLYVENGRELTRANTATLTGAPAAIQAKRRFLHRQPRSWHPRDGTFSRREAGSEFRHAVRPDAHHRRSDPPGLHREFNRSQKGERSRRDEPD